MFQQAYNKLKEDNDDRQKFVRYIKDNDRQQYEIPIDKININITRPIERNILYVNTEYGYDRCNTCMTLIIPNNLRYDTGPSFAINFTISNTSHKSTVKMWEDHYKYISEILEGNISIPLSTSMIKLLSKSNNSRSLHGVDITSVINHRGMTLKTVLSAEKK